MEMQIIACDIGTAAASRSPALAALEAWARRVREIETGEAEAKVIRLIAEARQFLRGDGLAAFPN
jgi:hypothetical protein